MTEKTLEERITALENVAHIYCAYEDENPNPKKIINNVDCHQDDAETIREGMYKRYIEAQKTIEKQKIDNKYSAKAKKKGKLFGDPVFVIE
jgi:hypothetical protein